MQSLTTYKFLFNHMRRFEVELDDLSISWSNKIKRARVSINVDEGTSTFGARLTFCGLCELIEQGFKFLIFLNSDKYSSDEEYIDVDSWEDYISKTALNWRHDLDKMYKKGLSKKHRTAIQNDWNELVEFYHDGYEQLYENVCDFLKNINEVGGYTRIRYSSILESYNSNKTTEMVSRMLNNIDSMFSIACTTHNLIEKEFAKVNPRWKRGLLDKRSPIAKFDKTLHQMYNDSVNDYTTDILNNHGISSEQRNKRTQDAWSKAIKIFDEYRDDNGRIKFPYFMVANDVLKKGHTWKLEKAGDKYCKYRYNSDDDIEEILIRFGNKIASIDLSEVSHCSSTYGVQPWVRHWLQPDWLRGSNWSTTNLLISNKFPLKSDLEIERNDVDYEPSNNGRWITKSFGYTKTDPKHLILQIELVNKGKVSYGLDKDGISVPPPSRFFNENHDLIDDDEFQNWLEEMTEAEYATEIREFIDVPLEVFDAFRKLSHSETELNEYYRDKIETVFRFKIVDD